MRLKLLFVLLLPFALVANTATAQSNLAAVMSVLSEGVEVQRVNTDQWIPVQVEAIVGVGDTIRTDETGSALITFFQDGVDTTLEPNTTYQIETFSGDSTTFQLSVRVLAGQTEQRLDRVLDAGSNYDVQTPGVSLVARGTAFDVRVEDSGRSAMIVTEGTVDAAKAEAVAEVPAEFGIRAEVDGALSEVVRAADFAALDAALDGCSAAVATPGDVQINVRTGASLDYPVVGSVFAEEIARLKGVTADGNWYRVDFRGGFGWLLATDVTLEGDCAGLRQFENNYGPEDVTLYEFLGNPITLDDLVTPTPTPAPSDDTEADDEDNGS